MNNVYTSVRKIIIFCVLTLTPVGISAQESSAALRRSAAEQAALQNGGLRPMRFAVKANFLYGLGTLTPNIGFEIGLGRRSTLDITGGYNWWNMDGTDTDNRKLGHWIIEPEYRRWLCERFYGHFFGVHLLGGMYNIAEHRIPLLFGEKNSEDYRYDGWIAGVGISYGYHLMLGRLWNLEFTVGVGYARMQYDRYEHFRCGELIEGNAGRNYFGPTKAGVTLIFLIK